MQDEISIDEQERLIPGWSAATFATARANAEHHYNKQAVGVGFWQYVREAVDFPRDRGLPILQRDGSVKYELVDGRFVIDRNGLVVTYGRNDD